MSLLTRILANSASKIIRSSQNLKNQHRIFISSAPKLNKKEIQIIFETTAGERHIAKGTVGDTFLNVVLDNSIKLEGYGACEGTLTCSTCHLVFKKEDFDRIENEPENEEIDMLELARDVTDTSRLGCQIPLTEDMDGIVVTVPEISPDMVLAAQEAKKNS